MRHFLESVVLEANSATDASAPGDDTNRSTETDAGETSEDEQMTERLRSFAATEDEPAPRDPTSPTPRL